MNAKLSSAVGSLAILALLLTTGGWAWQTAAPAWEPSAQEALEPQYVEALQSALDAWRMDNDLVGGRGAVGDEIAVLRPEAARRQLMRLFDGARRLEQAVQSAGRGRGLRQKQVGAANDWK